MSRARVYKNRVCGARIVSSGVAADDLDLGEMLQIRASAVRQFGVEFDCDDATISSDNMRDERCEVSGTASGVDDSIAFLDVRRVNPSCERARQSVVELAFRIKRNHDVIVDVDGIGVGRVLIFERKDESHCLPRSGTHKFFAGNFAQRLPPSL